MEIQCTWFGIFGARYFESTGFRIQNLFCVVKFRVISRKTKRWQRWHDEDRTMYYVRYTQTINHTLTHESMRRLFNETTMWRRETHTHSHTHGSDDGSAAMLCVYARQRQRLFFARRLPLNWRRRRRRCERDAREHTFFVARRATRKAWRTNASAHRATRSLHTSKCSYTHTHTYAKQAKQTFTIAVAVLASCLYV